jgi:hypothetical protein
MRKKRWLEREVITAVNENDLVEYLSSIGLLKEIEAGASRCAICGIIVDLENFGAVFPKGNRIHIVCEKPSCISRIDDAQVGND